MSEDNLWSLSNGQELRTTAEEQYRTTNTATSSPRVIIVMFDTKLPSNFGLALDDCVARYNNLNLDITFQRIPYSRKANADIGIVAVPRKWNIPDHNRYNTLDRGGFPTSGDPYDKVEMNGEYFSTKAVNYIALVLAHEIGHNIGFRHKYLMDRSFSYVEPYTNEGSSGFGAIDIPKTSTYPENGSCILSCTD